MIDVHAIDTTLIEEYDVIVLGGGAVGENVADRAVQGGLTAVIVEHELVGGECSYWACMPSQGAAALARPRCAPPGAFPAPPRPSPATSTSPPCSPAATPSRSNWSDDGQVPWLDERRHRPGPRPRPDQRRPRR